MADIKKIKPGQTLHSYHSYRTNAAGSKTGHWLVKVIEVDTAKGLALCSTNGNKPFWYSESQIKRLLVNPRK